jgi:hypothetical protein
MSVSTSPPSNMMHDESAYRRVRIAFIKAIEPGKPLGGSEGQYSYESGCRELEGLQSSWATMADASFTSEGAYRCNHDSRSAV